MKTAVIYARYSSDKQTEQSIEGQVRVCNEYARKHDIVIVDQYVDRAMTGTNDRREEFQKMLKDSAKAKWDYVLVYKLDRFSRDKYESAIHRRTLRNNGIKLVSAMENIPDSPEGIILESLLEGMNQYFSAELSQKVKRGMRESRNKGNYTGGPVPLGYKVIDKKLVVNEEEAAIVRHIFTEYTTGKYAKDIMDDLNARGIRNRGNLFVRSTMRNILANEKYKGIVRCNGEIYTNIYPQIVPNDTFDYVRDKLARNRYGFHNANSNYMLREKLICGKCGKTMQSSSGTARSGEVLRYYRCSGRTTRYGNIPCEMKPVKKEQLEEIVISVILDTLSTELVDLVADKLLERYKAAASDCSVEDALKQEMQCVEESIENIMSAIEKGISTRSTRERLEMLEERRAELQEQILCEEAKNQKALTKNDIKKYFFKAVKNHPNQMIDILLDKVIVYDDKIEVFLKNNEFQYGEEPDAKEEVCKLKKDYVVDTKCPGKKGIKKTLDVGVHI